MTTTSTEVVAASLDERKLLITELFRENKITMNEMLLLLQDIISYHPAIPFNDSFYTPVQPSI